MKNVSNGAASVAAQLSAHRRSIMDMLVGSPLITTAEYDTAMQRTLGCQDLATLQRWYRNTVKELARREEAAPAPAPVIYATAEQKEEIIRLCNRTEISRAEKTQALLHLDQYDAAQAAALLTALWAKVTRRAGGIPRPATAAQLARINRLLASPRFNDNHRQIHAHLLPGLTWDKAAQLIGKLRPAPRRAAHLTLASQGACPEGVQPPRRYAATVRLTRTAPGDAGGRWRRAQPGEAVLLSYGQN